MKLLGVEKKFFEFVNSSNIMVDNCNFEMLPTTHTPILESFGIIFTDDKGKYFYTSDTNDFKNAKQFVKNEQIKKIYCEASWKSYNAHIEYEMLKEIKCDKLVLMHFEDIDLCNLAIKDGFNVATISKE